MVDVRQFLEENPVSVGISLVSISLVVLALSGFFTPYTASTTQFQTGSLTGGNQMDFELSGQPLLFSTVTQGSTYEYTATVQNTGDVTWDSGWVNFRLGEAGSDVTMRTSDNVDGSFYVEECEDGTDTVSCREDLDSWEFEYNLENSYYRSCNDAKPNDRVCTVNFGREVAPGESVQIDVKMTVPDDADGEYPFIAQPAAFVGGESKIVAGDYDYIEIGDVAGKLSLQFVGAAGAVAGTALLAVGIL